MIRSHDGIQIAHATCGTVPAGHKGHSGVATSNGAIMFLHGDDLEHVLNFHALSASHRALAAILENGAYKRLFDQADKLARLEPFAI